jgi:hypothetical protein
VVSEHSGHGRLERAVRRFVAEGPVVEDDAQHADATSTRSGMTSDARAQRPNGHIPLDDEGLDDSGREHRSGDRADIEGRAQRIRHRDAIALDRPQVVEVERPMQADPSQARASTAVDDRQVDWSSAVDLCARQIGGAEM